MSAMAIFHHLSTFLSAFTSDNSSLPTTQQWKSLRTIRVRSRLKSCRPSADESRRDLGTSLSFRVKIEDMRLEVLSLVWRLDCLSCVLTVVSTILVGRRCWEGWVLAAANSLIICVIGLRTAQLGFIPANLFCIVLYAVNLRTWRKAEAT